jgi:hypothetical protein
MGFTGTVEAISAVVGAAGAAKALTTHPRMPPSPVIPESVVNTDVQGAQEAAQRRESIAGGIQSTVGTAGGNAGEQMNPATLGSHTLLGQ